MSSYSKTTFKLEQLYTSECYSVTLPFFLISSFNHSPILFLIFPSPPLTSMSYYIWFTLSFPHPWLNSHSFPFLCNCTTSLPTSVTDIPDLYNPHVHLFTHSNANLCTHARARPLLKHQSSLHFRSWRQTSGGNKLDRINVNHLGFW